MVKLSERMQHARVMADLNQKELADRRELLDFFLDLKASKDGSTAGDACPKTFLLEKSPTREPLRIMEHSKSSPGFSLADPRKTLLREQPMLHRMDALSKMLAKNHEEIQYRRNVIDGCHAKKKAEGRPLQQSSSEILLPKSPASNGQSLNLCAGSNAYVNMGAEPLESARNMKRTWARSNGGSPLSPSGGTSVGSTRRLAPRGHVDTFNMDDGVGLEHGHRVLTDVPPALACSTMSLNERLDAFEHRALWNAQLMSKHRKHLSYCRKLD